MSGIKTLQAAGLERAVITLDRAFANDPMFEWIFPEVGQRTLGLRALNQVALRYGLRYGLVTESDDAGAVAVWMPPGRSISVSGMVRSGMLGVPFSIGFRPFARFMGANDTIGKLHAKLVPEPHWYLLIVSVDPSLQGRGLGTALIEDGLKRADETHHPSYLETSQPRNVPFYERLGFTVVGQAALGPGAPPGWAMRRNARQ